MSKMKVIVYEEYDGEEPNGKPIERVSYSCPKCYRNYLPLYICNCPECNQELEW